MTRAYRSHDLTYQQVGEEDGHENEKDDPQYIGHFRERYIHRYFAGIHDTSGCLTKDIVKLKFACGHSHGFENGAGGIGEWGTGEYKSWLIEDHIEGEAKRHH